MTAVISRENLNDLAGYHADASNGLRWPVIAVLPGWLNAWWQSFGQGFEQLVLVAREEGRVIGIAPLKTSGGAASLCSLAEVLETGEVPARFFLSEKACSGILRRAEKRGKDLPPALDRALRQVANPPTSETARATSSPAPSPPSGPREPAVTLE